MTIYRVNEVILMRNFMDKDFLLSTNTAKYLYEQHAKEMPIFDYHSHLLAEEIYKDISYSHISEAWLKYDHYKWRGMRSMGFEERFITGHASNEDKFKAYAVTVQNCIGNPLYHWTHLELKKYFDFHEPLSEKTMDACLTKCQDVFVKDGLSVRKIIDMSNVALIGTTDDPTDDLKYHQLLKKDEKFKTKVVPTFRPDNAFKITDETFVPWIHNLEALTFKITTVDGLVKALNARADFFDTVGCLSADHGMDYVPFKDCTEEEVNTIFLKALNKEDLSMNQVDQYRTYLFLALAKTYRKKNWVMQLHIGTMRNNNTPMFERIGRDSGFDSVNDYNIALNLSGLLNRMHTQYGLPKTILYTLNPKDNYVLGTMIGNFQEDIKGKLQFGSAWWFNDHKDGMRRQLIDLANLGVLSTFVGMLTDSRSYLSFTRHDYFRRILCQLIGEWVENGEYPNDREFLGKIIEDISYNNAKKYFEKQA